MHNSDSEQLLTSSDANSPQSEKPSFVKPFAPQARSLLSLFFSMLWHMGWASKAAGKEIKTPHWLWGEIESPLPSLLLPFTRCTPKLAASKRKHLKHHQKRKQHTRQQTAFRRISSSLKSRLPSPAGWYKITKICAIAETNVADFGLTYFQAFYKIPPQNRDVFWDISKS